MIKERPRIHPGLVGFVKISQPGGKAPPDHRFRDVMSALLHPLCHPRDGRLRIRQAKEEPADMVALFRHCRIRVR